MSESFAKVCKGEPVRKIPSLDGMRAFSILAVVFTHASNTPGFPVSRWLGVFGDLGNFGVRVFFVISGFLITRLLQKEFFDSGSISLRGFYIRRIFRIFPAFYFYLCLVVAFSCFGWVSLRHRDIAFAGTYTINFLGKKSWCVAHLWSLAVEEQFYLLWPVVIVWVGWRKAKGVAIGAILAAPVLRFVLCSVLGNSSDGFMKAFPMVCDSIASGCLLACIQGEGWYQRFRSRCWSRPVIAAICLCVAVSNSLSFHTRFDALIGQTIRNIGIALLVEWCIAHPVSVVGTILNCKPVKWLGVLSYSLYLWQQVFFDKSLKFGCIVFPLNVVCGIAAAVASYYCIEKPVLRLRARLSDALTLHRAPVADSALYSAEINTPAL